MDKNTRRRLAAPISSVRWLAYSTAGIASAVGGAGVVEGAIDVVDVNQVFDAAAGSTQSQSFAIGADSFVLLQHNRSDVSSGLGSAGFNLKSGSFKGFVAGSYGYVSKLAAGATLGGGALKAGFGTLAAGSGFSNSQWLTAGQGYIGFTFTDAGGTELGWVSVTMDGSPQNTFTLNSYAYTTDGESLVAGEVPEPGSLALLAAGGAGLLAWRRRRTAAKPAVD